MSVTFIASF